MFNYLLKNLSILKKFLFINFVFFTIIGLFTFLYLKNIQPNLIKKKFIKKVITLDEVNNVIHDLDIIDKDKYLDFNLILKNGLLDEARSVFKYRDLNSLNTVGYKELFNYFDGKWTLEYAVSEIKKNSRRYAKRQMTWFRKDSEINWIDPSDFKAAQNIIAAYI